MAASLGKLKQIRKFRQVQKKFQILVLLVQLRCFFVVALLMPSSK